MELLVILILIALAYYWFNKPSPLSTEEKIQDNKRLEMQNNFAEKLKTPKSINPYRMDSADAIERGVVLLNKEEMIIDVPGYMARNVKTGAEWKSGNKGVRIRPSKYFGFSLGGTKGKMVSSTEFQKDFGYFTLTTKKLIFTGETHKFSILLSKIDNISRDEATVLFDVTSREVPDFYGVFLTEDTAKLLTGFISEPNMEINL